MNISFYKEERFEDTDIGKVPEDWEVVRLGDKEIAEIRKNKSINSVDEVAFISMELIPDSKIYVKFEIRKLEDVRSFTYCEAGDLLLAKITPCFENGKQGIVPDDIPNGFALATTEVFPITCKRIDRLFLFYVLKHPRFRKILEYSMRGTTGRKRVPKEAVENLIIPYPPLPEQQKIAEILSTVDQAIQKTDEIITKTERLKKGLMQELLSGRVRVKVENGKVSFYKETRFKDTEIGRIPEDWEVKQINEVISDILPGFASGKRDKNGIIQLRMDSITTDGRIDPTKYVKVPIFEGIEKYYLKPGDVIFNNTNSLELIGKTALYRGEHKIAVYSNHLTRIRTRKEILLPEWLVYVFLKLWERRFFARIANPHVNQAGIGKNTILSIKIPLPPLEEQKKIAEILSTVDKKLEIERKEKERLERIKKGLMDVLLTGKVRVRV